MAQIVLDHVDKVYSGGVKALDDLNLEVRGVRPIVPKEPVPSVRSVASEQPNRLRCVL